MQRQELQALLSILEAGSISGAASSLGVTPAALSKQLSRLEQRLGVVLFHRTTRSLSPTQAGLRLAHHARLLLEGFVAAERAVYESVEEPIGCLRLSVPRTFGRDHVAPLVMQFLRAHPQVTVDLRTTDRVEDLAATGVELAIRITHTLSDSRLSAQRLGMIERVLVVSSDYLASRGVPMLERLGEHDAVAIRGRPSWLDHLSSAPQLRLQTDTDSIALEAALHGMGITELPASLAQPFILRGELVRVLDRLELAPRVIWGLRPPGLAPLRVERFLSIARQAWSSPQLEPEA